MTLFYFLDLVGTAAFAISGASVAMKKRFDPFGVFIMAFVTAVGGGTLRDLIIDRPFVFWTKDLNYFYTITISTIIAIFLKKRIRKLSKSLFLFDTIGLGIFTIIGVEIGLEAHLNPVICVILGTMTGSFGGVVRDTLCNRIPVIFRNEVYATASVIGGCVYFLLENIDNNFKVNYIATMIIVIAIRIVAVKYKLSLPNIYKKQYK